MLGSTIAHGPVECLARGGAGSSAKGGQDDDVSSSAGWVEWKEKLLSEFPEKTQAQSTGYWQNPVLCGFTRKEVLTGVILDSKGLSLLHHFFVFLHPPLLSILLSPSTFPVSFYDDLPQSFFIVHCNDCHHPVR